MFVVLLEQRPNKKHEYTYVVSVYAWFLRVKMPISLVRCIILNMTHTKEQIEFDIS